MVYFEVLASAAPKEPHSSKFKLSSAPIKEPYFLGSKGTVKLPGFMVTQVTNMRQNVDFFAVFLINLFPVIDLKN